MEQMKWHNWKKHFFVLNETIEYMKQILLNDDVKNDTRLRFFLHNLNLTF